MRVLLITRARGLRGALIAAHFGIPHISDW